MEEQSTEPQQHAPRTLLPAAVLGALIAIAAIFVPAAAAAANESASAPGAPTGLAVAPGNGKLVAAWDSPEGDAPVTSYTVQHKTSAAADWMTAGHAGTGTDTEITGLTNGTAYNVRVRASNNAGDGPWSAPAGATPHQDIVWAAILTVDVDDTFSDSWTHGCADSSISTASVAECRTALTEDEFDFAGATYRWTSLYEVTDPWHHAVMGFDANVPTDSGLRTGTLQIGDNTIYLGETDVTRLRWFEDGDGWVVPGPADEKAVPRLFPQKGQKLPLSLKAKIPSNADESNSASQLQRADRELFEECRDYTRGLEGLRVCKLPFEGRDAVLMLTLTSPAPVGGTTVSLATSPTQDASSDDFTMPSAITIGEGEVSGLITIAITADDEDEGHETILIYACIRDGCDPLNPIDGEKSYNHGIVIPGTRVGGV